MQITKSPVYHSSAFRDALFKITATAEELVELDLYNHSNQEIIGRRRFTGATSYEINVANYAQPQFEIAPLNSLVCGFAVPDKRVINLSLRSGSVVGTTRLCAGIHTLYPYEKLSASPDELEIGWNERDEIALLCEGGTLEARAYFGSNPTLAVSLASRTSTSGLAVFCLKMNDVAAKATAAGVSTLQESMRVSILTDNNEELLSQRYRLVTRPENATRLCWWNSYGQIDYCTLHHPQEEYYQIAKEKIYTSSGYKVTGNSQDHYFTLTSPHLPQQTLQWLSEIAVSPRVWIERSGAFTPVDLLTEQVIVHAETLAQLQLTLREATTQHYPHQ